MGLYETLLSGLKRITNMFTTKDITKVFGADITVSAIMVNKISLWRKMYRDEPEWKGEDNDFVKTLNLPAVIASKLSGNITAEMKVDIGGTPRADFIMEQSKKILGPVRVQEIVEKAQALGGVIVKPYIKGEGIAFDISEADENFPVDFDDDGNMTGCIFMDRRRVNNAYYTRLEFHRFEGTLYRISNAAFRSNSQDNIGSRVPLNSVSAWSDIEEEVTIDDLEKPLFAYYKTPVSNNYDSNAKHVGVSAFGRATDLIEEADRLWSNFLWEFESGKRAMYIDDTALKLSSDGKPYLASDRFYRRVSGASSIGDSNKLFEDWTPTIRQAELLEGLDSILARIEKNCGLAAGTLMTNPGRIVEKTATEIIMTNQDTFLTIVNNQKNLESMLNDLFYAVNALIDLYGLAPDGEYEAMYEFDDSVIVDKDKQFSQDMQTKNGGMMPKIVFLQRNYKLTEDEARKWLSEQTKEAQADLELLTGFGGGPGGPPPPKGGNGA